MSILSSFFTFQLVKVQLTNNVDATSDTFCGNDGFIAGDQQTLHVRSQSRFGCGKALVGGRKK